MHADRAHPPADRSRDQVEGAGEGTTARTESAGSSRQKHGFLHLKPIASGSRRHWRPQRRPGTLTSIVVVDTPLGTFGVEATPAGISRVRLPGDRSTAVENGDGEAAAIAERAFTQLAEYARGERQEFDLALDWAGVESDHRKVLETLCAAAPYGSTVTYGELAAQAGIGDAREIGVHMSRNPFPVVVPCHRVVAADGLGGYGGGLELKRRLLELEGALPPSLDLGDV